MKQLLKIMVIGLIALLALAGVVVNDAAAQSTASNGVTFVNSTNSVVIIGANQNTRHALILQNNSTNRIWLGFGRAAVANTGITLEPTGHASGHDKLQLHSGQVFRGAIQGIGALDVSNRVTWVEINR